MYPGLFQAAADNGLAAGLDHTGADEEALLTEVVAPHPFGVGLEVLGGLAQFVLGAGGRRAQPPHGGEEDFDAASVEFVDTGLGPALGLGGFRSAGDLAQTAQVFAGVVEVDDLGGLRKASPSFTPRPCS
jgi:hypothetical protein